jgi:hypothetical protein
MRDSINANHMDIVKFEHRQNTGYQRIFGHILRLIREAGVSKKEEGEYPGISSPNTIGFFIFHILNQFVGSANIIVYE